MSQSHSAIQVDALSKRYRIGAGAAAMFRYGSLRDTITGVARRALGRGDAGGEGASRLDHIWALKDVTFTVPPGEVVGVIGRNGAGKSTLLKILTRLTRPTSGSAVLRGRVGSLLEVATGFHPELTGRDNVFLNGAILGMRRAEIIRKFDDIVQFSGIGAFIDTPVKRYSSGMYVRLAFAVAAHLEPEILLVDEVLAVGDAGFQKQCLGKLQDVSRSGRTVIFVSHNMQAVSRLCTRGLLLSSGRLVVDGPLERVIATYLSSELGTTAVREWTDVATAPGTDWLRLRSIKVIGAAGGAIDSVDVRQPVGIEIVFEVIGPGDRITPMIVLHNEQGAHVFTAIDPDPAWRTPREPGRFTSTAWIPANLLNEGTMIATVGIGTLSVGKTIRHAYVDDAVAFHVTDPGEGDTARGDYAGTWAGPIRPMLRWTAQIEALDTRVRR